MTTFSRAIANGALAKLTTLDLEYNNISDTGMQAFSTAIAKGALAKLESLNLHGNAIGDPGLIAFASVCASDKALKNLKKLVISRNKIGHSGIIFLSNTIQLIASLEVLVVNDGSLGAKHKQLRDACSANGIELIVFGATPTSPSYYPYDSDSDGSW